MKQKPRRGGTNAYVPLTGGWTEVRRPVGAGNEVNLEAVKDISLGRMARGVRERMTVSPEGAK